jgi:aspartyl-tRNA(Asn)/glutamyl-tRNA(Gln) amidotransferase subunit A
MGIEDLLAGRLAGAPLSVVARAVRAPQVAALAADVLRRDLGMAQLPAMVLPADVLDTDTEPRAGRAPREAPQGTPLPSAPAWVTNSAALESAYAARRTTPSDTLERLLSEADAVAQRQPFLRCIHVLDEHEARRAARASTVRHAAGAPLSALDGVPVVVKEQLAVQGLPRRLGHELPGPQPAAFDATLIARLRAAGAVIVGLTPMTELGMSPIGVNPKRQPMRNPHHIGCAAGGSSTGSGIAVSLGLVPLAVGCDGGGSVRIPAASCGVFGLKASFGRVSSYGDAFGGTLNQAGPIAISTHDVALFFDAVAADVDPRDPATRRRPHAPASFVSALTRDVRGLTVGVDRRQLRDAQPSIAEACERAIDQLIARGVNVVDLTIPLADIAASIGYVTIASEVQAATRAAFDAEPDAFGLDMQVMMAMTAHLSAREYLGAQMLRARLRREVARLFERVDALVLPTTQSTALHVTAVEERTGRLDARGVSAMCRHTFLANLTGLPAGTVPVGLDAEGLPIGLQILGDAWDEHTVLALMAELERAGVARAARPPYHAELIEPLG